MSTATLSSKYQITIPAHARRQLKLRAGHGLQVVVRGNKIELTPEEPARALLGLIPRKLAESEMNFEREEDRV
jgi:AbrB family looped-hinge helix DNA binding protein